MTSSDQLSNRYPQNILCWFLICMLTAFAVYRLLNATTWGIGFAPDSLNYLTDARSIIDNKNLVQLGSHWPPLYSLLIAFIGHFSEDLLLSIKWLQVLLYLVNLLLFPFIIYHHSGRSFIAPIAGSVVLTTSTYFMRIHAVAWSEPVFIFLALCGLHFLASYLHSCNCLKLAISSLLIGLSCITRYAGLALLLSGILSILLVSKHRIKKRLSTCFFFGLIGFTPLAIWITSNILKGQSATNRTLSLHPIAMQKLWEGVEVLLGWLFIPAEYGYLLILMLIALCSLYVILKLIVPHSDLCMKLLDLSVIFIFVYQFFILISISLFDSHTPLDYRILIPVYIFFLLAITLLYSAAINNQKTRIFGYVIVIYLALLSIQQFKRQTNFIVQSEIHGIGFADKRWINSDTLLWLKNLDKNWVIYTNAPEPVLLYAGKEARLLPRHTIPATQKPNPDFLRQMELMNRSIQSGQAIIVYFPLITWRWYLPNIEQINESNSYRSIFKSENGVVFARKDKNNTP